MLLACLQVVLLGSSTLVFWCWWHGLLCRHSRSRSCCRAAACQVEALCQALWPHTCHLSCAAPDAAVGVVAAVAVTIRAWRAWLRTTHGLHGAAFLNITGYWLLLLLLLHGLPA